MAVDVGVNILLTGASSFSSALTGLFGQVGKVAGAITGLGGAVSGAGIAALTKQAIDAADELGKMSTRTGVAVEQLSAYKHIASLADVSMQELTTSWRFMSKSIDDATQGVNTAQDAYRRLGVNIADLKKLSPEQQFERLADAFGGIKDQGEKTALAMDVFGRSGIQMMTIMEGGSKAINAAKKEAEDLGLIVGTDTAKAAEAFNDAMTKVWSVVKSVGLSFAADLTPYLQQAAVWIGENLPRAVVYMREHFGGLVKSLVDVFVTVGSKVGPAIGDLAMWLGEKLPKAIEFARGMFGFLRDSFYGIISGITSGLIKFYDLIGKIPGSFFDDYRAAAETLRGFKDELDSTREANLSRDAIDDLKKSAEELGIKFGEFNSKARITAVTTRDVSKETEKANEEVKFLGGNYVALTGQIVDVNEAFSDLMQYQIAIPDKSQTANAKIMDMLDSFEAQVYAQKEAMGLIPDEATKKWSLWEEEAYAIFGRVNEHTVGLTQDIKSDWETLFENIFTGSGDSSVKEQIKNFFDAVGKDIMKTLADIVASAAWKQIVAFFTGDTSGQNFFTNIGNAIAGQAGASAVGGGAAGGAGGAAGGAAAGGFNLAGAGVAAVFAKVGMGIYDREHQEAPHYFLWKLQSGDSGFVPGTAIEVAPGFFAGITGSKNMSKITGGPDRLAGWINLMKNPLADMLASYSPEQIAAIASAFPSSGFSVSYNSSTAPGDQMRKEMEKAINAGLAGRQLSAFGTPIDQAVSSSEGFASYGDFAVTRPRLIMVGENAPERVSIGPLSGRGNGGAAINFNGPVMFDEITLHRFKRMLVDA